MVASGKRRTNNQTYNWIKSRYPDLASFGKEKEETAA
jgi:hypothetical protein